MNTLWTRYEHVMNSWTHSLFVMNCDHMWWDRLLSCICIVIYIIWYHHLLVLLVTSNRNQTHCLLAVECTWACREILWSLQLGDLCDCYLIATIVVRLWFVNYVSSIISWIDIYQHLNSVVQLVKDATIKQFLLTSRYWKLCQINEMRLIDPLIHWCVDSSRSVMMYSSRFIHSFTHLFLWNDCHSLLITANRPRCKQSINPPTYQHRQQSQYQHHPAQQMWYPPAHQRYLNHQANGHCHPHQMSLLSHQYVVLKVSISSN